MRGRKDEGRERTSSSLLARLLAFFLILREESRGWSSGRGSVRGLGLERGSLEWMREWRVSSSEREKRFSQPRKVQAKGFSPVCVRM